MLASTSKRSFESFRFSSPESPSPLFYPTPFGPARRRCWGNPRLLSSQISLLKLYHFMVCERCFNCLLLPCGNRNESGTMQLISSFRFHSLLMQIHTAKEIWGKHLYFHHLFFNATAWKCKWTFSQTLITMKLILLSSPSLSISLNGRRLRTAHTFPPQMQFWARKMHTFKHKI